ncbi:MAG TPA: hypothetical protein VNM87_01015, partial [Candidatus Udaeobacter sp.]|nr:hypothetical protein [Candidatus Udaeobacter sp.]
MERAAHLVFVEGDASDMPSAKPLTSTTAGRPLIADLEARDPATQGSSGATDQLDAVAVGVLDEAEPRAAFAHRVR